jgi:hypothetical protein
LTRLSTPDRASPALQILNWNLYNWRTTSRVCCLSFHREGVFIGLSGTSTDLERSVWHQVVAGRPSHVADRPVGTASTDLGFSSSCRRMVTKAQAELPQTLAGQTRSWAGWPTPLPTRPRIWPTWSTCQIHPRGDGDFEIWSTSLCHHLKCSNLLPKFLKSNKH